MKQRSVRTALTVGAVWAALASACSSSGGDGGGGGDGTGSSGAVGSSGAAGASSGSSGASGGSSGASGSSGTSGGSSSGGSSSGEPAPECASAEQCPDAICTQSRCVVGTASDGVKNGRESDVDCGQSGTTSSTDTHAPACVDGKVCGVGDDCVSRVCVGDVCLAPSASDGVKNGNESDVDCGHSGSGVDTAAPHCADGKGCAEAADCQSGVCVGGVCAVPTRQDQVKNGNETDVDCGSGPTDQGQVDTLAPPCADQGACLAGDDCSSLVCTNDVCQAPTCTDGVKNHSETDVDCGGANCAVCTDGKACLAVTDCQSGVCANGSCQVPTRTDGVKNGNETDVDCGRGGVGTQTNAPVCADTKACVLATDCKSGVCTGGQCRVPTRNDGVKNGNETDVDCGSGPIVNDPVYGVTIDTGAGACANARACLAASDCQSGVCTGGVCQAPSYTDGIKNGNETDVDCGGDGARGAGTAPQSRRCVVDKVCVVDADCKSDACDGGVCQLARSCAGFHHGGDTCGTGDETWPASANEPDMFARQKKHESCCTSVVVERPEGQGGNYRLDKYPITAGRMRKFIEVLANGNLDNANVASWVQSAREMINDPAQLPAGYDAYLPTAWNAPGGANTCGAGGNEACNYGWVKQLGGFRYNNEPGGAGGFGCYMNTGAYGSRTFRTPDAPGANPNRYRAFNGETDHLLSQERLDQKALNCVNYVMLAAFCAWDGGRLESKPEHAFAYGGNTYPWGAKAGDGIPIGFTFATSQQPSGDSLPNPVTAAQLPRLLRANWSWNYSNLFVLDRYYWFGNRAQMPLPEPTASQANDQSFAVAPPGRYPLGERVGVRDLAGNQMEITASGGASRQWSKNGSFEGTVHTPGWAGYDSYNFNVLTKYGRTGGRCARPLDGYPAQQLPKR